ncbi:AMP-binding protein [Komarekiella sp. 'clone 1']|uniref:AMP-binding protein n=1 Tax=Komarekiella delphini-convector SJRDD-AB1 TaxID=2593771 RepID=A0AA40T423_9NOST|nr:AMP-binding protein [Komarekiella delphini-convector]MBD6620561.1 AMP-binding protein [Komarekiella delphini-convector SJRDD-AB1]
MNKLYFGLPADCSTLVDLLSWRSLQQKESQVYIFLRDGEVDEFHLTYKQLESQARAIGALLQSMGAYGERALLLYPPGLEFITAFFGCLYAGVVAVPAYPPRRNQKVSRLQAIVANSQAKFLLTTTSELVNIESRLPQNPELIGLHRLATDNLNIDLALEWQQPNLSGSTLAFLQYTSGSTGTPKGVMVSHQNLLHNEQLIKIAFGHTEKSIIAGWLPLFHDMGLIGNVLQPLYLGVPCILMSPVAFLQKPVRWLQAISRYKATTSGGPNFAYDLCVDKITAEQRESLDLSSWDVAFNGAEPIRAETLKRFTDTFQPCGFRWQAFYPCYGMAETTLFISGSLKTAPPIFYQVNKVALEQNQVLAATDDSDFQTIVGCGVTMFDQIAIVDPKSNTQCSPEQVGEIWVSGLSVAQGYWNQLEATKQTFNAYLEDTGEGPFLRTGDLGFLYKGELYVTGRLKDVIIIRGRNHYPQDIELTVEQSHPALYPGWGAAFAVEVEGKERLVIVQEIERSYLRSLDVNQVVEAICKAVSQQHELQVYAVLLLKPGSIPKTSSGKIQRYACKAGYLARNLDTVGTWSANTLLIEEPNSSVSLTSQSGSNLPVVIIKNNEFVKSDYELIKVYTTESIQNWIVNWLSKALKIKAESIEIRKSFAEYGVDSQIAVELAQQLEDWLKFPEKIEPTIAWSFPDIASLAEHLANEVTIKTSTSSSQRIHNVEVKQSISKLQISQPDSNLAVEQLSPEQIELLINKELSELENLLEGSR